MKEENMMQKPDYQALLIRYMGAIIQTEGVSFLDCHDGDPFTPEELAALRRIERTTIKNPVVMNHFIDQQPESEKNAS